MTDNGDEPLRRRFDVVVLGRCDHRWPAKVHATDEGGWVIDSPGDRCPECDAPGGLVLFGDAKEL